MTNNWRGDFIQTMGGKGHARDTLTEILRSKDITPRIDDVYLRKLKKRLVATATFFAARFPSVARLPRKISDEWDHHVRARRVSTFNNQGRRREPTFYVWMQGQLAESFLDLAIAPVLPRRFRTLRIGGDNPNEETIKRLPTSDLQLIENGSGRVRFDVQAGMDGKQRHIKLHKIQEAIKKHNESDEKSYTVFFDFNSGELFLVRLDDWRVKGNFPKSVSRNRKRRKVTENPRWEGVPVIEIIEKQDKFMTIDEFMNDPRPFLKRVLC